MPVKLQRRLLAVDQYHKMISAGILTKEDRVELLRGEIIEMSPLGSLHAAAVRRLDRVLNRKLIDEVLVSVQCPIQLDDLSEPEPDLAILVNRDDFYELGHPKAHEVLWVVEIADSSLQKDRYVKSPMYAEAGIPVYWIVNLTDKQIEIHERPENGIYKNQTIALGRDAIQLPGFDQAIEAKDILG